jgi:hypothetical protein
MVFIYIFCVGSAVEILGLNVTNASGIIEHNNFATQPAEPGFWEALTFAWEAAKNFFLLSSFLLINVPVIAVIAVDAVNITVVVWIIRLVRGVE